MDLKDDTATHNTLTTTWETPESCPYCMEHLSLDWAFCPQCGRKTDWNPDKEDNNA